MMKALEAEIRRHDWDRLRVMGGTAAHVPDSIIRLVEAQTDDQASAAYWELEGYVVVQGQLFEAAPYVVPCLLAGLLESPSLDARKWILELLFQIVSGTAHSDEIKLGSRELHEDSRVKAQEGIAILYGCGSPEVS